MLLRGLRLGEIEDVLLDATARRVLGFVVRCGDGARRVLPLAAADPGSGNGHVSVSSALVLMEDGFYRERAQTLSVLTDAAVSRRGVTIGTLVDVSFDDSGRIRRFEVDGLGELPATDDLALVPEPDTAAD